MSDSGTQKEQHRLGTIGRWDAPDADWAADYDWTRYRGPDAYPVPGDWVLSVVEGDGIIWYRYPDIGDGFATDSDVMDALDDMDDYNDGRAETAMLGHDTVNPDDPIEDWESEQQLKIDGTVVFERVEPATDELFATVARVLDDVDAGVAPADIDVSWQSGRDRGEGAAESGPDPNASLGDFE